MMEKAPGFPTMQYEDKSLSCADCNQTFIFAAGEQQFFAEKNLTNVPRRCPTCRVNRRLIRDGKDTGQCTDVKCEQCGASTRVPFKPTGRKPVYCIPCFKKQSVPLDAHALEKKEQAGAAAVTDSE